MDEPVVSLGKVDRKGECTELEGRRWQVGDYLIVGWFGDGVWEFSRAIIQDNVVFSQV